MSSWILDSAELSARSPWLLRIHPRDPRNDPRSRYVGLGANGPKTAPDSILASDNLFESVPQGSHVSSANRARQLST